MTRTPVEGAWLRRRTTGVEARLRLVCFPHAGRGASLFHGWPTMMSSNVEVIAVQLPGRENRLREPPARHVDELTGPIADELTTLHDRPLVLFGHSMGALVAFEVAQTLRRYGEEEPLALIVACHRAPHLPEREAPISALPEARLVDRIRRFGGTPNAALQHPELRAVVLPTLRADLAACESYTYSSTPPLRCRLTAIAASSDRVVDIDEVARWADQTTGPFTLRTLPGDHLSVLGPSLIQLVADDVTSTLAGFGAS